MTVIPFPVRLAAQRPVRWYDGASAEIIAFPPRPAGLTRRDVAALAMQLHEVGDEWLLETGRDGKGALWAMVAPRDPSEHEYRTFLIGRRVRRLFLVDARLTAQWKMLGVFARSDAMADALRAVIGTPRRARPRAIV